MGLDHKKDTGHGHGHHWGEHFHLCYDDILELLKFDLENESKARNAAQLKYSELNHEVEAFQRKCKDDEASPDSKYDALIVKQTCANESMLKKIKESREKLEDLTVNLKSMQVCGKDCDLNMKDLIIHYDCIGKADLLREIKRFERMQIDLKSNLDRLQWRLDCEAKVYYNTLDQFQKLQVELYYLHNLGEKCTRYAH